MKFPLAGPGTNPHLRRMETTVPVSSGLANVEDLTGRTAHFPNGWISGKPPSREAYLTRLGEMGVIGSEAEALADLVVPAEQAVMPPAEVATGPSDSTVLRNDRPE